MVVLYPAQAARPIVEEAALALWVWFRTRRAAKTQYRLVTAKPLLPKPLPKVAV